MKLSICNEVFSGMDITEVLLYVKRFGYNGIEIAPFTMGSNVEKISSDRRREIRKKAIENSIEIVGTHWVLVCDKNVNLFNELGEVRKEALKYLITVVEFTSEIGGRIVVFGSPKQRSIPSKEVFKKAWDSAVSAFREIGDSAKEKMVVFCIEPLSKDQTNFINNVSEAIKFIKDVDHENIRLILDVRSMCDEKRSFRDIIKEGKTYLEHFHANDCNGYIPGSGSANYKEIVQSLIEIEYSGYLSVEVFDYQPNAETIAVKSLENLKKFFREYGNIAL
ncbi:MAG: sugar phosphate isomerase/epimerase [Thaumarchaeota archaeon]|jgi:sugar phosphate isomerase/epimerase|nr:sugar phosphate isomerase/epimerase [Nitrososphaerota archaeon]